MSQSCGRWEGGCRCGQVRFRIGAAPMLTMACHCTGCQRMTGSAFSLSVLVAGPGFEVTAGEPVIGGLHGAPFHHHCPHCMSWMFTRMPGMDLVNVRSTLLDEPVWTTPYIETCTDERLPWAKTPAAHSFAKFPEPDEYGPLIAEFAAQAGV